MISETYKKRAHLLIKTAKKNGMITNYSDFCKTKLANDTQLNEEEISYYTNKNWKCFRRRFNKIPRHIRKISCK